MASQSDLRFVETKIKQGVGTDYSFTVSKGKNGEVYVRAEQQETGGKSIPSFTCRVKDRQEAIARTTRHVFYKSQTVLGDDELVLKKRE